MAITGSEFKALEVQEQVQFVNDCLTNGYSVDQIRMKLGIGKNYIANKFKYKGYIRDKVTGIYIKNTGDEGVKNTNTTTAHNRAKKTANTGTLEIKVNKLENEIDDIKAVLHEMNSKLNGVINTKNTTTYITVENTNSLGIKKLKGNKVTRSYKLNEKVQKEFKSFCKAHSDCEVGDILATALIEYMERNK